MQIVFGRYKSQISGSEGFCERFCVNTLQGKASSTESTSSEAKPSYLCITPDLVWSDVEESVKFKYQVFIHTFEF